MADAIYAIDDFPDDDVLWRIVWIGGVGYNTSAPSDPLIDVCLAQLPAGEISPLSAQSRSSQTQQTVKIGVGLLPYIAIASVWRQQRPVMMDLAACRHRLRIDASSSRIVALGNLTSSVNAIYRLRMMSGSLSAAMEQGCWCELQGAYFANWKASQMVIPYGDVGAFWWDSHFISLDYGFGKSSASAHLHVRTQDGKIKTIGEFVAPHLPAYEFAGEVVRRFVAPTTDKGNRRRIVAVYLDPANFKNIGDGHTIANQINEVLEPYDLGVIPASNDRIGGWQLMYQMLQKGQWKIADTCPKLIEAIPSRMHDEKKPGDVLKVPGSVG